MRMLVPLILTVVFSVTVSAGDAPQVPTPVDSAQAHALQTARAAGYDAESKIMELERRADEVVRIAKIQSQQNKERGRAIPSEEAELRAMVTRIQQESRVAKRAITEGLSADEPEKGAFEAGQADARAGKPRPKVDAQPAGDAGADPKDPLARARAKGHAIGLEMIASEQKTKALLNEALEAEKAGNTTRLRAIKAQINVLLAEKSAREKAGLDYATGLTQAERDAYVEGIQAAQAGK